MDLEMGLWPRTGSTHPLSAAYHHCCCTPSGLLTNNMNLFELVFVSRLYSLQLQLNISFSFNLPSSFPSCTLNFDILKAQTPAPSKLTLRPPAACSLGALLPIVLSVGLIRVAASAWLCWPSWARLGGSLQAGEGYSAGR